MNIDWLKSTIEMAFQNANGGDPSEAEVIEYIYQHIRNKLIMEMEDSVDRMKRGVMDVLEREREVVL